MTAPVGDLIALERQARGEINDTTHKRAEWAAIRRQALLDLHAELGTWQKVADATGQKLPTVHKAANQPRKKKEL